MKERERSASSRGKSGRGSPPHLDQHASIREMSARDLRKFHISKGLLERLLDGSFRKLFQDLTGLQLHLLWHEVFDSRKSGGKLKLCPALKGTTGGNGRDPLICEACLEEFWATDDPSIHVGRRIDGRCGLSTFRAPVALDGIQPPLTLAVQALIVRPRMKASEEVTEEDFLTATALVRLIKHDLQMALRADSAEQALVRLRTRLPVLRKEERLLRTLELQGDPVTPPVGSNRGEHKQRVVQRMVAYVHEHFHRPMSLSQVAAELGMNAAYLSDLFSTQLGMTFRDYLLEVRMARARQLLLTPHRRISEVACAVGYSSVDQFRHAFKHHAGVSPSQWQ